MNPHNKKKTRRKVKRQLSEVRLRFLHWINSGRIGKHPWDTLFNLYRP